MKKLLAIAVAVAIAAPAMSADAGKKWSVGLNLGYTTVNAKDVNKMIDATSDYVKDVLSGDPTTTKMGGGLGLGLEGSYVVADNLAVGLRLGSVMPFAGKVSDEANGKETYSASAMPIEVGARYMVPMDEKLSLGGGLFLGYALASAETKNEPKVGDSTTTKYNGNGMVLEVMATGSYKVTPDVAVGLDLGYRMLNNDLTYAKADDTMDIKAGDKVKDAENKQLKLDLSGIIAAVSVSYLF